MKNFYPHILKTLVIKVELTLDSNDYGADKGVVISNNFFTKNAYTLAKKNNIELWDRKKLIQIRNGSRGKFIGCSNFPKCKYTRNIS